MAKREFLMLAKSFDKKKISPAGWWESVKLDGIRCFWDGGISRGLKKANVPWANTLKDSRYVNPQIATGLWSRYGHVIHANDSWLDALPKTMLDGELWAPGMLRQDILSIVKTMVPIPSEWEKIKYFIFGIPSVDAIFGDGKLPWARLSGAVDWATDHGADLTYPLRPFRDDYIEMKHVQNDIVRCLDQNQLPFTTDQANSLLDDMTKEVVSNGGEGVVIRDPNRWWIPERCHWLLKVKPWDDAEGTVIDWIPGKGKLEGLIGAYVLDIGGGKTLELSGFTNEERRIGFFPTGTVLTFRYRGLSKDGIPQEARYWRKSDAGIY